MNKKKIILGVTVGGSSKLLEGQPGFLKNKGFEVYLMSPQHYKEKLFSEKEDCIHIPVKIQRNISPIKDILTLFEIIGKLKKIKPDLVNFGTPKMGFLGIIAAMISGVKVRVYTCRGLRYETETGFKRKLLMFMERLSAKYATKVIYVSHSLLTKAVRDKVAFTNKSVVLGQGSSNGVNLEYFSSANVNNEERNLLIGKNNLADKFIIGFIGRITEDKGVEDLVKAFKSLEKTKENIILILVGHLECSDTFKKEMEDNLNILWFPFTDNVPLFLSLFDLFVLPSYREGFPNVPIQAAAMGLPVITTDATGCVDSVKHEYNGLIYKKGDSKELEDSIKIYLESESIRKLHSQNSINWAKNFANSIIWDEQYKLYKELMK